MRLATVLREYLWASRTQYKDLAQELEVSPNTVSRFLAGGNVEGKTLQAILIWLLDESLTHP